METKTKTLAVSRETWLKAKKIILITGESLKDLFNRLVSDEAKRVLGKQENE